MHTWHEATWFDDIICLFKFFRHEAAGIYYIPWPAKPAQNCHISRSANIAPKLNSPHSQLATAAKIRN